MILIDTHAHLKAGHPAINELLEELGIRVLNVAVASGPTWRQFTDHWRDIARKFPQYYAWCTSFDLPDFTDLNWADRTIEGLQRDFQDGAVAVKMWKNIGMELKDTDGRFVQMDHEVFTPIYEYLTKIGKPILAHMAEPIACWEPLDENNVHLSYYAEHPEWHMYGRDDIPSHAEIIAARDRVLAQHPKLNIIAAHMSNMAHDLKELGKRLDAYPNLAIDTTREYDLSFEDPKVVREFFTHYQDRITFATDMIRRQSLDETPEDQRGEYLETMRDHWTNTWGFYDGSGEVVVEERPARGIDLPAEVLRKLRCDNARRWYPGLTF